MRIKEELWKNKGYVVVARNDKGYIQGWVKSDRPVEYYVNRFKRMGSFKEGIRREILKNVIEYTDFKKKRISGKYQIVIEGYVNGKKISSRSVQRDSSRQKSMKEEAEETFRRAVLFSFYNDSDPDISPQEEEDLFKNKLKRRREGIVYYKARSH